MSKRGKNKTLETAIQPLPGLGGGSVFNPLPKQEGGVEVEKLHKQPRGYLKTTAKLVGKATDEKTLFSLPEVIPESWR